jgi:predicted phage tail protein
MTIIGAGGGGGGGGGKGSGRGSGGSSRTPSTAPDSLDSRQYANVIDLISEGEIQGLADGFKSIFLNNTALQNPDGSYNFQDVTIYTRNGTQNQTYIPLGGGVSDTKGVGITVVKNVPQVVTITDPNVDAVRVTIAIPLLQQIDTTNGDTSGASVRLQIAVNYAGGGYTTVIDDTISGRTADEYRKDYLIQLARPNINDNVVIQVTRITDDSTSSLLTNAFSWLAYTEIIDAKLTYPNSALVGLRVDAEQFSSIPTRSYLIKGIKVQIPNGTTVDANTGRIIYPDNFVWNGTFSAATWTSCPAWILWDLLTSTRYGFGNHISANQLDKWAFFAASKYSNTLVDDGFGSQEARFSCNTSIQTAEEAYKLVNDLLSIMRCQAFWSTGSLTIAQDAPSDPVYLFNQANVTPEGFSYSGSSLKIRPNVAVVSYLDLKLRDTAYEVVEDTDSIAKYGVVRSEISAFACTSRGQANRIGKWLLFSERYEKEVCTFASSLEAGQQVRPGQIILISDPVRAGSRRAGRVAAATNMVITVDDATEITQAATYSQTGTTITVTTSTAHNLTVGASVLLDFTSGTATDSAYTIVTESTFSFTVTSFTSTTTSGNLLWSANLPTLSVILGDGTVEARTVASISGNVMTVSLPFSSAPNVNSIWILENPSLQASTWRVLSINESDGINYGITAIAHNESKYAYIEDGVPLEFRDTTNLNEIPGQPSDLTIISTAQLGGGTSPETQYEVNGRIAVKITFGWRAPQGVKKFRVKYRFEDDNFITVTVQGTTFDILDAKTGNYQIQVSSISSTDLLFSEPALANYTVAGLGAAPSDVQNLSAIATGEDVVILSWRQAPELDVQVGGRVIIRHDPRVLASADWNSSNDVVQAVAGSSTQKQVPLLPGTYFLKFEDFLGNRSTVATGIEVTLPEPESRIAAKEWAEQDLATPFSGTKTNCTYDAGETALVLAPSVYVSPDYWETIYCAGDCGAEYQFADTFDLGDVYDFRIRRYIVSRPIVFSTLFDSISGDFDAQSGFFDGTVADQINVATYVRTTPDDPAGSPTYGPWTEFASGMIRGRGVQVKAIFTTETELIGVAIDELGATLELTRRVTTSLATLTSSSSAVTSITFPNAFYKAVTVGDPYYTLLPSVGVTGLALGSNVRTHVTNLTRTGFDVEFLQGGSRQVVDFTYNAVGYGRAF